MKLHAIKSLRHNYGVQSYLSFSQLPSPSIATTDRQMEDVKRKSVSFVELKKKRTVTCPMPLMYALNWSPVYKLTLVSKTLTSIASRIKSFIPLGNKFLLVDW